MTLTMGETVTSVEQGIGVFGNQSGVITLLRLDPESVIEVHKPDGTTIKYQWVKS